jgi:DNA-binding GntR family transcriptional regulator/transposase
MDMLRSTGSAAQVCAAFAISRPTLRKWRQRFEALGPAGLDEPSRAPAHSPNRKVFAAEESVILELRRTRKLGVHRLRGVLRERHGIDLSADTILKVLRRAGEPPLRAGRRGADGGSHVELVSPPVHAGAAIGELITTGAFRPGEKLSEGALAGRLGIGRTLVRETLRQLAISGLVVLRRHRGAFVAQPSLEQVRQAYAARRLIEGAVIADVCGHCTAHDIRRLRSHLERQVAAEASGQRQALVKLLTEFHMVIASLGENRVLDGILADLTARTSLAVMVYDHGSEPSCAIEEHRQLIDLLAAGDTVGATRLMQEHLTTIQRRLDLRASNDSDG